MAVSRTSSDWLLHPSLVFKTFEESLIKSPFSYGNSPHIVPEKIVESFVDQNGIRCYRVKWLDSWLTEQHVTASFPHLITEYWINKPINDTNVDYQNYIVQGQAQGRNLANIPLPVTSSNNIGSAKPVPVPRTTVKAQTVSDALQQQISQQPSTSITISQLFNSDVSKEVEIPCPSNNVEQNDNQTNVETDFNVAENNLELAGKTVVVEKPDSGLKADKKFTNEEQQNTLPEIPKISESSMVFLFDKNSNYAENNQNDREKSIVSKMQAIPPFNPPPFKNHISTFTAPPGMRLPSMEQINQQPPHIPNLVTVEVATLEKKPAVKRSPAKPKPAANKDKQPVVCDLCGKTISSRKNLRVHKTVKHFKNGSFACQICGRKFALNRDLKRHMPLHTNERKYACPHCGLQCKQPGHLTKHIRTHTEVMNWRCDCCFKNFKVQAELKKHCFTEHADINKENLTCSVCKEKLKLPNSVYLHSLRHSGVREFQCHICKASFKLKQHMQVHMKTHEKPKDVEKIICPICTREFRFKHTYEKHFSKHVEKSKEEYEENKRLRLEEKRRKQEKKGPGEIKARKKKIKEDESMLYASDGEEAKNPHKRKLRRPEKVLYDKEFKTKLLVREKDPHNLRCELCDVTFDTEELLDNHVREVHKNTKFVKSMSKSVSFLQGDQVASDFPTESQMVMLKLPEPIIVNNEPNKSSCNNVSESLSHAGVINVLSGMHNKEVTSISKLTQLDNRDESETNNGELRIDIGAEDTVESSLPGEFQNKGNNTRTTVNS